MFRLINHDGRAALEINGDFYDVGRLAADESLADCMSAVRHFHELHKLHELASGREPDGRVDHTRLEPCVPRPSKVFGIGLNYRSHALESNMEIPSVPLTFTKFPSCISGPGSEIHLRGDKVDWEVELVAVIGVGGSSISTADAWQHVAGLTLGQDISDRRVQFSSKPPQFSLGKSFDTFGPIGPALVSVDSFEDPDNVPIWCDISGERMQEATTDDLIFSVADLVAYLSSICTLEPGDLIFSGTPSGVGAARGRFLRAGDVVTSGCSHIGHMSNRCVDAS